MNYTCQWAGVLSMVEIERELLFPLGLEGFREEALSPSPRIALVNLRSGEKSPNLADSLATRVLATAITDQIPEAEVILLDPAMDRKPSIPGQILKLRPDFVGVSMPQGTYEQYNARELLSFLQESKIPTIVGGDTSTWNFETILKNFPGVVCVLWDGDQVMVDIVKDLQQGRWTVDYNLAYRDSEGEVVRSRKFRPAELDDYPLPDRKQLMGEFLRKGGLPRAEWSRGCPKAEECGSCSYCVRFGKEKYRLVPTDKRIEDIKNIQAAYEEHLGQRLAYFEIADEELFGRTSTHFEVLRATAERIKEEFIDKGVKVRFSGSTRPDMVLELLKWDEKIGHKVRTLDLLKEAGLQRLFLGLEGATDECLEVLEKDLSREKAIAGIREARQVLGKDGVEVGIITLIQRARHRKKDIQIGIADIRALIDLMGEENLIEHVSQVLNIMDVRKGTKEAKYFKQRYGQQEQFGSFNISLSRFEEVPWEDEKVARVASWLEKWRETHRGLYYALKGLVRSFLEIETPEQENAWEFLKEFRQLDFNFLDKVVLAVENNRDDPDILKLFNSYHTKRNHLVARLRDAWHDGDVEDKRGLLHKEIGAYFETHTGAVVVLFIEETLSENPEVVLAIDKEDGSLMFVGGEIKPWETPEECATREAGEETGRGKVRILGSLPGFHSKDTHYHLGKKYGGGLTLHTFLGVASSSTIEWSHHDHEIKRLIRIPLKDLISSAISYLEGGQPRLFDGTPFVPKPNVVVSLQAIGDLSTEYFRVLVGLSMVASELKNRR